MVADTGPISATEFGDLRGDFFEAIVAGPRFGQIRQGGKLSAAVPERAGVDLPSATCCEAQGSWGAAQGGIEAALLDRVESAGNEDVADIGRNGVCSGDANE